MSRNEYYSDQDLRVSEPLSERRDLVRIELFRSNSVVAHNLIQPSPADESDVNKLPYEFAGLHRGMPSNEVWAITYDNQPIEELVPEIIQEVQRAIEKIPKTEI